MGRRGNWGRQAEGARLGLIPFVGSRLSGGVHTRLSATGFYLQTVSKTTS
jgi:hypothetical protein